jgi:ABC-type uncharacterized transport system permease subunit
MISSTVDIMTPFLLAALGGLLTELAGTLVIALEGFILIGAFSSIAVAGALSAFIGTDAASLLGTAAACVITTVLAWLFGRFTVRTKANIYVTALAVNLLAAGLTAYASAALFGTKGVVKFSSLEPISRINAPALAGIPVLGELLSGHSAFVYLSWILVILVAVYLKRTRGGLRLRAAGMDADAEYARGLDPRRYRISAITACGFFCALAGADLSLGTGAYIPNISAGRGWIALVAIYLGNRTAWGVLAASALFACAEYLSNIAQGAAAIPGGLLLAFPYLATLAVFVGYSILRGAKEKT